MEKKYVCQIDNTFENLKSDPVFRRDEMNVTCRNSCRGVRKWLTWPWVTCMDIYFTPPGPLQCKQCLGEKCVRGSNRTFQTCLKTIIKLCDGVAALFVMNVQCLNMQTQEFECDALNPIYVASNQPCVSCDAKPHTFTPYVYACVHKLCLDMCTPHCLYVQLHMHVIEAVCMCLRSQQNM